MTKDEILKAIQILKALPIVKEVYTAEINGQWAPFMGIEIVNGDYVGFESLDEVFAFAGAWGISDMRNN